MLTTSRVSVWQLTSAVHFIHVKMVVHAFSAMERGRTPVSVQTNTSEDYARKVTSSLILSFT